MYTTIQNIPLLGIIGTQEIIILIIITIPIVLIMLAVRSFKKIKTNKRKTTPPGTADEIEKLFVLKQKNIITQQEFSDKKAALLK